MYKYNEIQHTLSLVMRSLYNKFGMKDYDLDIVRLVDRDAVAIRLVKTINTHDLLRSEHYGDVVMKFFEPMYNSERHIELVEENLKLKKLLAPDETEGLNLEWE